MKPSTSSPFGTRIGRTAAEVGDASADLLESAGILDAVEVTIDSLQAEERHMENVCDMLAYHRERVTKKQLDQPRDPDDEAEEALQRAQTALREAYRKLTEKRAHAVADGRLAGEKEDAIVASYDLVIKTAERMHDLTEDLRAAIREHDAEVDKLNGRVSQRFTSAEDIVASLDEDLAS